MFVALARASHTRHPSSIMVSFADGDFLTGLGDPGGGLHCPTALTGHAGSSVVILQLRVHDIFIYENNLFREQLERWFYLRNEDKCISRGIVWRLDL